MTKRKEKPLASTAFTRWIVGEEGDVTLGLFGLNKKGEEVLVNPYIDEDYEKSQVAYWVANYFAA